MRGRGGAGGAARGLADRREGRRPVPGLRFAPQGMDPHRNIFFFYRGPIDSANVGIPWDSQLENNTTKALINILEFLPPYLAALPFLKLVVPDLAEDLENRPLAVSLQRIPEVALKARHKVPVLLRPGGAIESPDSRAGGRPDAFI